MTFQGLGLGFFNGFTGIVTQPIKGAIDDGFKGFGKGFIAGSLGVVVKPGAGLSRPALHTDIQSPL